MSVNQQSESDNATSAAAVSDFLSLLGRWEESYHFINGDDLDYGPWRKGQSVWVCKSQGRKQATRKQRTPELFLRARILNVTNDHETNDDINTNDNRILVQYPAGSTYRVRRDLLVPILEATKQPQQPTDESDSAADGDTNESISQSMNRVVVYPETNEYRRACVTHTDPTERFWEIGCAQGITCHRVQQQQQQQQQSSTAGDAANSKNATPRQTVVGLDKSKSSIATARQRYPDCHFFMADILDCSDAASGVDRDDDNDTGDDDESSSSILTRIPPPQVIGVDIGGNRDLEPVLQCLKVVLTRWQPRLVLVKSRALHHCLRQVRTTGPEH